MAFDDQGDGGAISQINVTPLVDVMLVLLVIFMVTAPILQQGVQVNLPKVEATTLTGEGDELMVTVSPGAAVFLNDTEMQLDELASKLAAIAVEQPDKQIFLRADEKVPYGEVMQVISALKTAGVRKLGMVTEPPSDS